MLTIPKNLTCPLTMQIFYEPVFTTDGHTYEKEYIENWFSQGKNTSPSTGSLLTNQTIIPNWGRTGDVNDFLTQYPEAWEEVYFPKYLIAQCLELINNKNAKALKQLLDKDKRLLTANFSGNKKLIEIICEQGTPELLSIVIEKIKNNGGLKLSAEMNKSLLLKCYKTMQLDGIKTFIIDCNWIPQQMDEFLKIQIEAGCEELVKAFIEADIVSVNKELDQKGNTALHIATMKNYPDIAKTLIALGANCKLENKDGHRPEKLATLNGQPKLATNIINWRQNKKFEPLREEMRKQKVESEQQILFLAQQNKELQEKVEKLKGKVKTQKSQIEQFSIFSNSDSQLLKTLAEKEQHEKEKRLWEEKEYSYGRKARKAKSTDESHIKR